MCSYNDTSFFLEKIVVVSLRYSIITYNNATIKFLLDTMLDKILIRHNVRDHTFTRNKNISYIL